MQVNDITPERLRRLAAIRAGDARVLSLFVNLDPRGFATPAARRTEVRSLLERDRAPGEGPGPQAGGGGPRPTPERSTERAAAAPRRRGARAASGGLRDARPAGLLAAAPAEAAGALESHLHPYLRDRLAGRLD